MLPFIGRSEPRIPDTISWDNNFEPAGSNTLSFTVKVLVSSSNQPLNGISKYEDVIRE